MAKRWRIHPHDPQRVLQLERAAGVPAVVAQLLLCRGIHDPIQAKQFLAARLSDLRPPEDLPGASQAAELIQQAVDLRTAGRGRAARAPQQPQQPRDDGERSDRAELEEHPSQTQRGGGGRHSSPK